MEQPRISLRRDGTNIILTIVPSPKHESVNIDLTEHEISLLKSVLGVNESTSSKPRKINGIELTEAEVARWDALMDVHGVMIHGEDAGWNERVERTRRYCIDECTLILESKHPKANQQPAQEPENNQ